MNSPCRRPRARSRISRIEYEDQPSPSGFGLAREDRFAEDEDDSVGEDPE